MAKKPTKLIAIISIMSALGNVLGFLSIRLPSAPGTVVEFHLSALPALLLAVTVGPLTGAVTGALSLIIATMKIGNIFIPFGNALLAYIAGLFSKKFKLSPPASGAAAVVPYTPYMWFACSIYGVPEPIIAFIVVKAFIEILISCTLIEFILLRREVKDFLVNIGR
ncbi:ECF transporter S component [Candidatus Bathyarchaeota archaeon]|nr:ECF transporter S component [Candidatus Bathyarchaeota archaeon]MBS7613982.1 ECF transporter S component [Candidatus Bathyarchaeota archaeon]MBS7617471.1 ECF transporter S component [Candidatus Bathyarchaeota archaeon]